MHTDGSLRAPGSLRLFANGRVHAFADVPAEVPPAEAVLVRDGRVVAVGSTRELRDRAGAGPVEEVDLEGRVVLPGFVDAHLHAVSTASTIAEVDIRQVRSLRAAVETVAAHAATLPPGEWVTGGRWDSNTWDMGRGGSYQPDRELLDEAVPDRPVALWSIDYHTLWLNGAALEAVGIHDDTPIPSAAGSAPAGPGAAPATPPETAAPPAAPPFPARRRSRR